MKILSSTVPSSGCPHADMPVYLVRAWPANMGVIGDERKLSWLQSDLSLAPLQAALVNAFFSVLSMSDRFGCPAAARQI